MSHGTKMVLGRKGQARAMPARMRIRIKIKMKEGLDEKVSRDRIFFGKAKSNPRWGRGAPGAGVYDYVYV